MRYYRETTKIEAKTPTDDRVSFWKVEPTVFCPGQACKINIHYEVDKSVKKVQLLLIKDEALVGELSTSHSLKESFDENEFLKKGRGNYLVQLVLEDELVLEETIYAFDGDENIIVHENAVLVSGAEYTKRIAIEDVAYLTTDSVSQPYEYAVCGKNARLLGIKYVETNYKAYLHKIQVKVKNNGGETVQNLVLEEGEEQELSSPLRIGPGAEIIFTFSTTKPFPEGIKLAYKVEFIIGC